MIYLYGNKGQELYYDNEKQYEMEHSPVYMRHIWVGTGVMTMFNDMKWNTHQLFKNIWNFLRSHYWNHK
jgi:hypothetical protein